MARRGRMPGSPYHHVRQMAATVPCPACGRDIGQPCVTAGGVDTINPHRLRIRAHRAKQYAVHPACPGVPKHGAETVTEVFTEHVGLHNGVRA